MTFAMALNFLPIHYTNGCNLIRVLNCELKNGNPPTFEEYRLQSAISKNIESNPQVGLPDSNRVVHGDIDNDVIPQNQQDWQLRRNKDKECPNKHTDFSIEQILGNYDSKMKKTEVREEFEWLQCTRYRPPKLQRMRKKNCVQRRKLGRNARIPFTNNQITILEDKFKESPYLNNSDVTQLAKCLFLSQSRVKIWFQNRRARERRDSQDISKKTLCMVKSFLEKTRFVKNNGTAKEQLGLSSESAFKPCCKA